MEGRDSTFLSFIIKNNEHKNSMKAAKNRSTCFEAKRFTFKRYELMQFCSDFSSDQNKIQNKCETHGKNYESRVSGSIY